jgi:hypothetical protein
MLFLESEVGKSMSKERMKRRIQQIRNIVLIVLVLALVGTPIFAYFRIKSDAHLALREAKNVKLTLEMLDIEYYANGKSVYDSSKQNGLRDGVEKEITKLLENDGSVILQSYSRKKRTVQAFTYTNNHYEVIYYNDKEQGDTWKVHYLIEVLK